MGQTHSKLISYVLSLRPLLGSGLRGFWVFPIIYSSTFFLHLCTLYPLKTALWGWKGPRRLWGQRPQVEWKSALFEKHRILVRSMWSMWSICWLSSTWQVGSGSKDITHEASVLERTSMSSYAKPVGGQAFAMGESIRHRIERLMKHQKSMIKGHHRYHCSQKVETRNSHRLQCGTWVTLSRRGEGSLKTQKSSWTGSYNCYNQCPSKHIKTSGRSVPSNILAETCETADRGWRFLQLPVAGSRASHSAKPRGSEMGNFASIF